MARLAVAFDFLERLVLSGEIGQTTFDHARRVRDLVAQHGGTERDQAHALLHEIADSEVVVPATIDRASLEQLSLAMPDYLRHEDDDLERRAEALFTAPSPLRILWLCDMIDTFETPLIRLDCPSEEAASSLVRERCRMARDATQACAMHPRFADLVARARAATTQLATLAGSGLPLPRD